MKTVLTMAQIAAYLTASAYFCLITYQAYQPKHSSVRTALTEIEQLEIQVNYETE